MDLFQTKNNMFQKSVGLQNMGLGQNILVTDAGLERKAATQVREFEKLAFAYFALVGLTSVHKICKWLPKWPMVFLEALNG